MKLLNQKMCLNKRRYPNRKKAELERKIINMRSSGEELKRSYHCPYCRGWHLTSKQ
jgi:hypothetical protein